MMADMLTVSAGATGPLIVALPVLRPDDRKQYPGRHATAMVTQPGSAIWLIAMVAAA